MIIYDTEHLFYQAAKKKKPQTNLIGSIFKVSTAEIIHFERLSQSTKQAEGFSLVVEHLPSMHEVLDSITSIYRNNQKVKYRNV